MGKSLLKINPKCFAMMQAREMSLVCRFYVISNLVAAACVLAFANISRVQMWVNRSATEPDTGQSAATAQPPPATAGPQARDP
jgi:hypothetical protein